MESKHFFSLAIIELMTICCSGCGTLIGTTINTTVSPDFNIKEYKRFHSHYDDETYPFLGLEVNVFLKDDNLKRFLGKYGEYSSGDMLVLVNGHLGFGLPPGLISHQFDFGYTFPRLVSVEIQDAVTKKQLLLCVYKSGFFSMCSYSDCRKMIIAELQKAFDESRKKHEVEQPASAPK